ncbi:MAG: sulfite exporter TauE/SafE family protein, partial [Hymenobacter sp.]
MLPYFGYFAAIFIGLSLGIMGGGGSILTVPVLVYLMGVSPVLSTAYSLFVVGSTSVVGAAGYFRKGLVSLPTALVFLGPSLAAVFVVRKVLMPSLPHELLRVGSLVVTKDLLVLLAFAVLMVAAATSMIRRQPAGNDFSGEIARNQPLNYPLGLGIGLV